MYKKITNGVRENTSDFRSWSKAGDINVLVPPRKEQDEIVDFLNQKCLEIDEIISTISKEIALVQELRTKTIADVVTGKVDVRGVVVPDYAPEEDELDLDEEIDESEDDIEEEADD